MKILYISPNPYIPFDSYSGAGAHIRGIVNSFKNHGHTVYNIIAGGEKGKDLYKRSRMQFLRKNLKHFVPLSLRKLKQDVFLMFFYTRIFYMIKQRIGRYEPDVLYIRSGYLDYSPIFLKRFNIPIILEVNGILWKDMKFLYHKPLWQLAKIIELKKYKLADSIIAIGALKNLIEKYNISKDKIFSVENGVTSDLNIDEGKVKDIYEKYKIPKKMIIGFVGTMLKWHKLEYLVYAAERLLNRIKDTHFLIVGGGELKDFLVRLVKRVELAEYFTFTGLVNPDEVNHLLSIMDICTIPGTLPYSSSVKLLNYGLLGKPVVVPRYPYMEELLENKKDGLLFKPGSISDFSEKIFNLIENADLRSYLGKNLQNKVIENYTWDKIGKKTLSVMERVLNGRK